MKVELSTAGADSTRLVSEHAARQARALQRELKAGALGATLIHVLILLGTEAGGLRFQLLVGAIAFVTAFNVALSKVGPRRLSVERLEWIRIVVNTAHTCFVGTVTSWELAVWLFFPYVVVVIQDLGRHARLRAVFHTAVASALALWQGVAPVWPASFSVLSLICYWLAAAKSGTIREFLEESDEQRREIDRARAELARANEQIQRDMELLKKTEMDLRQAQKLEAVGRLASGIAHEINTPVQFVGDSAHFLGEGIADLLRALRGYRLLVANGSNVGADAEELARRVEEDADVAYLAENLPLAVARVQDGLERVGTIVRSMKEFAHPDQGSKVLIDLNRSVRATLTISRNEYKYVAEAEMELGELPPVPCFAGELNQVLLNLVVNAAHAIADVHAETGKTGKIVVRTFQEAQEVVIQISDTGTGIPEAVQKHIFEPFFTTKEVGRGTGQGLAIARAVVERHGGTIGFSTTPGHGTTFTIRLPIPKTPAAGQDAA